jgi:hypothetical protein
MIRFEGMAYTAAVHPGRMGARWQASAARVHTPTPHAAASLLRSAWCKQDRCGVWPAAMSLADGADAVWELEPRGGEKRFGKR